MYLALLIAHLNTTNLPATIHFDLAVDLARLSQRYDLNHILIGYLDNWLAPHRLHITAPGLEAWLYVAWQFGLGIDYTSLANHLALTCSVDEQNNLLKPKSNEPFSKDDFPPRALCQ